MCRWIRGVELGGVGGMLSMDVRSAVVWWRLLWLLRLLSSWPWPWPWWEVHEMVWNGVIVVGMKINSTLFFSSCSCPSYSPSIPIDSSIHIHPIDRLNKETGWFIPRLLCTRQACPYTYTHIIPNVSFMSCPSLRPPHFRRGTVQHPLVQCIR